MAQDPVDCYADEPGTEILPFLSVTKPARLGLTGAKHGPVHNAYAENVFGISFPFEKKFWIFFIPPSDDIIFRIDLV
jgi:hypothetical protein